MDLLISKLNLSHRAVMKMLEAAVKKAEEINCPQCIVIVDASGELLGEVRMTGAKFLSRKSARAKALTAASTGIQGKNIPENMQHPLALASQGDVCALPGGMPIKVDGQVLGGIGIGSGNGEQDIAVASAALEAIGADSNP